MPQVGTSPRARATRLVGTLAGAPDARKGWDGRAVRVRALVGATGMQQGEVAARLGVSERSLRRYMADGGETIGYGDLCNLERLVAYAQRSMAAAEGRRRRKACLTGKGEGGSFTHAGEIATGSS